MRRIAHTMWHEDLSVETKVRHFRRHLLSGGIRYTRMGLLAFDWTEAGATPGDFELDMHLGADRNGYEALETAHPDHPDYARFQRRRSRFVDAQDEYPTQLEKLRKGRLKQRDPLGEHERAYLEDIVARVRAMGAEPIFVISPRRQWGQEYLITAAADGVIPVLFDYADPDRYASIYDADVRFDSDHLTQEGAELWTKILADDLLEYIEEVRSQ